MTPLDQLRATLEFHGFHAAAEAESLRLRDDMLRDALATWTGYPASMDRWPKRITGRVKL
jgi:hypothetical protein